VQARVMQFGARILSHCHGGFLRYPIAGSVQEPVPGLLGEYRGRYEWHL